MSPIAHYVAHSAAHSVARSFVRLLAVSSLLLTAAVSTATAQEAPPEFLIEVLVVEPVDARSDAWPVDVLKRYDDAIDPGLPATLAAMLPPGWAPIEALGLPIAPPLAPRTGVLASDDEPGTSAARTTGEEPAIVTRPWPFVALSPIPDSLAAASARLVRGGDLAVVAARSWLQPAGTPRRRLAVRLYDEHVLQHDPLAEATSASTFSLESGPESGLAAAPSRSEAATDPGRRPIDALDLPVRPTPGGETQDGDPISGSAAMLPPIPQVDTRLDGRLALVQRQFLHAELDLEWREAAERPGLPGARPAPPRSDASDSGTDAAAPTWRVHRLQQSRVIRPDRWTYFDSERFGVLLRVTELPPLLPPPEPEPEPAAPALPDDPILRPVEG